MMITLSIVLSEVQGKGKVPLVTVGVLCKLIIGEPPRLPEQLTGGRDVRVKWAKVGF